MGTKNSITSLLEQFMILQRNSLEIISKISEATTSNQESVPITVIQDDGSTSQYLIPSFGFIKQEISRIDNNIQQLSGLGDAATVVKLPDGTTKKIFEAAILRDPTAISTLQVPAEFRIKNNWFFESFLNPLLYVSFDVTGLVPEDMRRAVVKRIIVSAVTDEQKKFFDDNYKGKNDINFQNFLIDLDRQNIAFFVDEDTVELPLSVVRYKGTFDVLKISDEEVDVTSNSKTITVKKRKYKLDKLAYTDILSGLENTKTLKIGDAVITQDGSKYEIESLDAAENTVVFRRLTGSQAITIGANILTIYSPPFRSKEIQVNVGFDERQVIFLKPIDANFDVAASSYSPGVGVWTNELSIPTTSGNLSLETFYKTQVVDFGLQFINAAKEKTIPSVLGEIPNAPTLDVTNFPVLAINEHKKDTKEAEEIKQKLTSKVKLENEIRAIDESINNKKNDLNNNSSTKSDAEKRKIKADLETLAREKISKVNLYSSVVKELATKTKENPTVLSSTKYAIRGFFPIPAPKPSTKTGDQEVVQFKIAYRYIKKDGNAPQNREIAFRDNDGTRKSGSFSNWTEIKSDVRKRIYNETTGFYEWDVEDVQDNEAVNINQVDIPISKGEQVQIRIKSLSEAGWPLNPLESDWSDIITIPFPEDLQIADDNAASLTEAANEETRVKFQEELNARGLDLHLLSSFTSGDRYYAHASSDIQSGFFTAEGKIIDLFEKLKSIDTELTTIRQLIEKAKGTLVLFLIDSDGNVIKVNPNSSTSLFAGYYKDLIKTGSGTSVTFEHGKVITKTYILRVENSAATSLELASYMFGGQGTIVDASFGNTNTDYANNRRYDHAPLTLTGVVQPNVNSIFHQSPFQSAQVKGLWAYMRYKNVGLDEILYGKTVNVSGMATTSNQTVPTVLNTSTPINGCYLFPTDPGTATGPVDPNVWNGSGVATGGGYLSEFCLHKDHPDITGAFTGTTFLPQFISSTNPMVYPKFMHSDFFWKDVTQTDPKQQLTYVQPAIFVSGATDPTHYPAKLGFYKNDEFLVGKYTCGAYLFLAPLDYTAIAVDGTTELAKRLLEFGEEKAINIPLVFQFRCSDKLAYVGGYRLTGNISNITYTKKIGIDIQIRNESLVSFDVEVSCKYEQDTLVQPVFVPNVALDRLSAIRSQTTNTNTL